MPLKGNNQNYFLHILHIYEEFHCGVEHKAATMGVLFVLSFSAAILFLGMHRGHCARIPGGQVSIPHSRPYMAALVRGNVFKCGGSLIRENWVLTAAHCQINIGDKVILGAHSLSKYENEKQEFQVVTVIRPRNYNSDTFEHDIMLLQLNGRARLNRSVKTVQLPRTYEDVRVGTQCLVLGWGATYRKNWSEVLQEITVTIFDRHVCKGYYTKPAGLITTNKLCAGVTNGGACS
ncbi:PREDICTED: granzyme A-like, partial [Gekko japonicus]|uniref:Granzyme A-like n=1 Tax=Gekko japonicus TaxID=146911 RepID=A0ABM1KLC6_GEKJA